MKWLRFLFLIFRRGSLRQKPFNFEGERRRILNGLPHKNQDKSSGKFNALKTKLMQSTIGYSILVNLSYFRHAGKMNVMLFVSSEKKLVYLRILKSASTSVLKELLPVIDKNLEGYSLSDEQVDALAFRYLKKELTSDEEHYTQFALVRNPFHRIVSVYLDLFGSTNDYFSYESYWFGILNHTMTFSEFIDTIFQIPDFLKGPHFASQHYILSNLTNASNTLTFSLDKDQETLQNFLSSHGLNLHHQNKNVLQYDYASFYNTDLVNKVYDLYKDDVIAFNYKAEYNQLLQLVSHQENRKV